MSLQLELLPIAAGLVLLLAVVLMYLVFSLPPEDDSGRTWYGQWSREGPRPVVFATDLVLAGPVFVLGLFSLAFLVSGVGWLYAGHLKIGLPILVVRGYISMVGGIGLLEAEAEGIVVYYVASMAMAAASVLALSLATRPRVGAT